MGVSYSTVITFLSSYTKSLNLVIAGSFFFVIFALVVTFTRPGTGQLFDIKGENMLCIQVIFF